MVEVRSIGFHEMFTSWKMCGCGGGATLQVFFCGGDDSNGSKEGSLHWHSVPPSACACDTRQRADKITNNRKVRYLILSVRLAPDKAPHLEGLEVAAVLQTFQNALMASDDIFRLQGQNSFRFSCE